jgi:hypothetical protein
MRLLPLALLALLTAAALAGCGDDEKDKKILDTERVERAIEQSILEKRQLRAQVSCPAGTERKKGVKFRCTATYKGGSTPFEVTVDNDQGAVHYRGLGE